MTIKTVLHLIASMIWIVTLCACDDTTEDSPSRPNILFIMVDDLRPQFAADVARLRQMIAKNISERGGF